MPVESLRAPHSSPAPALPDAGEVLASVKAIASENPSFAALLARGAAHSDALAHLALQFFQQQRFPEAAAMFRSAVALAPGNPVLWTNYGTALDRAGSFAEAAACLEHSLGLSGGQPDTWLLLGLVRKKVGDMEGCEAAYRQALEQQPESGAVWRCLALLKSEQRNYAQAIGCFAKALQFDPTNAAIAANLGKLQYETGQIRAACGAYAQALRLDGANPHYQQMARKLRFVRDVLDGESVESALETYEQAHAQARAHAAAGLENKANNEAEKQRMELLQSAFGHLSGFGYLDAARRVGKKHLELWPGSPVLSYLMNALDGKPDLDHSPRGYLVEYFDAFASGFDAKLVGVLGYDLPEKICSALRELTRANHKYQAVDAGCGTGLCGPLLRPMASQLIGVDLSPKMLEHAAKRGVYDQLICEDLTSFLTRWPGHFDLVVAADVLIYNGNLAPIFAAAARALRIGGLFAFSTEFSPSGTYRLQPSGRFEHSQDYVRSVAGRAFAQRVCTDTTIRLEAGKPVPGNLFVFQRESRDASDAI
jgi:predicted TPR repeat methyltransferase